ncbi:hypothetical protein Bca4012_096964 [Brassica carinata]
MDLIQSYDGEAVSSSPDSSPPDASIGSLSSTTLFSQIYGYAVDYSFRIELRWRRGSKTTAFLFLYIPRSERAEVEDA